MNNAGEFQKFTDAFKVFFSKIIEELNQGRSLQWLETSNFIVYMDGSRVLPMGFYDARDFAYDIGFLVGKGEFQKDIEEPTQEVIEDVYAKVAKKFLSSSLNEISYLLRKTSHVLEQIL